ncbi:hypothetical protein PtA15_15A484 [Puccinia triticina]|uniref:Uncharacterized protein n=1 Tax=Puccinia triticina TaxID=208348 RepID=A0ABY7D4Q7_9BASI|nr:uncharacterized protein PtA15_15A484 [Puccinia triticina]WAQ92088.1 hypothetical protein PtA15_15A484 [Puccinia triticina]
MGSGGEVPSAVSPAPLPGVPGCGINPTLTLFLPGHLSRGSPTPTPPSGVNPTPGKTSGSIRPSMLTSGSGRPVRHFSSQRRIAA